MSLFYKLYHKKVFKKNKDEHLTELQDRINGNPVLIDIDIRYDSSVKFRKHNVGEITDIVELYCDVIKEIFEIPEELEFKIFVFEKPDVVISQEEKNNYTKDGIHMFIQLHMEHNKQMLLRKFVIQKEKEERGIFGVDGLNCQNTLDDIFDERAIQYIK